MIVNEKMYELGSKRSAIRDLFEFGKKRAAEVGPENVYDFSIGNPSIPAPACVNEELIRLLSEENSVAIHGYTSAQGDQETREAIANHLNRTHGTSFRPENFYMTCGAAASLTICFHALISDPADEIIAIAPFFPEYRVFAEGAGARFVVLAPDRENFQIDMKLVEEGVNEHTRAIIVNSPNNPSGVVYSRETIEQLAELLRRKEAAYGHPIYIICDEPYREIAYDVEVPFVTKYYADTLVCYSYSKSLSLPGERIGWILVPDEAAESAKVYAAVAGAGRALGYVCAPSLMQKMLVRCIGSTGDIAVYRKNRDLLYEGLTKIGYHCQQPEGAFYMFVEALEADSQAFCKKAMEQDLLLVPADSFGCPGWLRVAYCVDYDMIARSLPAFERLYKSYKA